MHGMLTGHGKKLFTCTLPLNLSKLKYITSSMLLRECKESQFRVMLQEFLTYIKNSIHNFITISTHITVKGLSSGHHAMAAH